MRIRSTLLAIAFVALSTPAGAGNGADVVARIQLADGSETTAHAFLERGETARLKVDSGYSIDLTYREGEDGDVIYEYRFLRWNGKAFSILHTANRRMPKTSGTPVGYAVCGDGVMFVSHPEAKMPACLESA
ncbi:MAG: hypothetical protein AAF680_00115 [Pseudomonadota bacterium]